MILPLILSAPTSALFSCFNQSHCRLCKFRASRKSIPRLAGWLITWCKRGSRVRKSQQSQLYSVVAPSVSPLRWILWGKKTEAHHVVIILCSVSLSLFPTLISHAIPPWMEQRMNLGSSSWVRQLFIDCAECSIFPCASRLWNTAYKTHTTSTTRPLTLEN